MATAIVFGFIILSMATVAGGPNLPTYFDPVAMKDLCLHLSYPITIAFFYDIMYLYSCFKKTR